MRPKDALYAFVADLEAFSPHLLRYCPERLSLSMQGEHLADGRLLALMRRQFAMLTAAIAKRQFPCSSSLKPRTSGC